MRIEFNNISGIKPHTASLNRRSLQPSFGSITAQPENEDQIQQVSQIAYKTREIVEKRFGLESSPVIKANITQDTVKFSPTNANESRQNLIDSVMQYYLKKTNIPFKQV